MLNSDGTLAFVQSIIFSFILFVILNNIIKIILDKIIPDNSILKVKNWNEITLKIVILVILFISGIGIYLVYQKGLNEWFGFMGCIISLSYILLSSLFEKLENI